MAPEKDKNVEQVAVVVAKLESFEKNMDEKFVAVNCRLDRVESLRDRVVILETEATDRDKRLVNCERTQTEVQNFINGLGWKSAALLLSIVLNLIGCVYAIYTIKSDRTEEAIRQHLLEDVQVRSVVTVPVKKHK